MDRNFPSDNLGKVAMVRRYRSGGYGLEVLHSAMIAVDDPLPPIILAMAA